MKRCGGCKTPKPLSEFNNRKGTKDGKQSICRGCSRKQTREWMAAHPGYRKAYDAANKTQTLDTRLRYLWRVAGMPEPTRPRPAVCECCNRPSKNRRLALDHDHTTGVFRGWLCASCNTAIGMLGDSIPGVAAAIEYLLRSIQP